MMAKRGRPPGLGSFHSVKRAKELLESKATTLMRDVLLASKVAAKRGNHAPAVWALEHISVKDESGKDARPIAGGIDAQVAEGGASRMPTINIGWVVAPPAALPVVEALPALPAHIEGETE